MREYRYRVDADGRVFHDGTEIVDPLVLRFFLGAMKPTVDGRHLVVCQGEHNFFDAEDTPFVVQRVRFVGQPGRPAAVELRFAGDWREALDPATLETEQGRLYCRIRRGTIRARFGRIALTQLAPHLTETDGGAALVLAGARHPIRELIATGEPR